MDINSISSSEYSRIKEYLDSDLSLFLIDDFFKKDTYLPVIVCGLFVAIKEKKYREKSLFLLNRLVEIHTMDTMCAALLSKKGYKITGRDITSKEQQEIISYMFSKMHDPNFIQGVVCSMGFYLDPRVLDLLKQYTNSKIGIIKEQANYSIDFIEKRIKSRK